MATEIDRVGRAVRIQRVLDGLANEHAGTDPGRVRELLVQRLNETGAPTGAHTWLTEAAADISAGRRLVVDARHGRPLVGPVLVAHPGATTLDALRVAVPGPTSSGPDRFVLVVVLVAAAVVALILGRPRSR